MFCNRLAVYEKTTYMIPNVKIGSQPCYFWRSSAGFMKNCISRMIDECVSNLNAQNIYRRHTCSVRGVQPTPSSPTILLSDFHLFHVYNCFPLFEQPSLFHCFIPLFQTSYSFLVRKIFSLFFYFNFSFLLRTCFPENSTLLLFRCLLFVISTVNHFEAQPQEQQGRMFPLLM